MRRTGVRFDSSAQHESSQPIHTGRHGRAKTFGGSRAELVQVQKARHYVEKNAESLALGDRRGVQTLHSAGPSTGIRHISEAELAQARKGKLFGVEETVCFSLERYIKGLEAQGPVIVCFAPRSIVQIAPCCS